MWNAGMAFAKHDGLSEGKGPDKHFSGVLCVSECFGLYDFNYYLTLFVLRGRKRPPLSWVSS